MSDLPTELKTGRMSPLARLPAFFALAGKRAVVAGGGQAAAWKAELLSAAGATVDVFAPHAVEDMRALATVPPDGAIILYQRAWNAADLSGAAIAVAECENDHEAARFAAAARAAGVPVNVIDRPAFCDFSFGAIVNRSPLVIGISTDGAAPVFGQAIRAKIEALIPKGFARWAEAARAGAGALISQPAQSVGVIRRARRGGTGRRADRIRFRGAVDDARHSCRGRVRYFGRRRPRRSGAVDAARSARAAIGRRDFV
jgi:siroheme synthase-like protein